MSLADAQLDRYARHIVLKEIGGEGQRRLLDSAVGWSARAGSAARPSSISPPRGSGGSG